jgi:paired amphipathic helix protein Sin3a
MDTSGSVVHEEASGFPIQPPDEMVIDSPPVAATGAQAAPTESKEAAAAAAAKKAATTIKIPSIVMNAGSMGEGSNLASPPAEPEGKLPSISIPKAVSPTQVSLPPISPMVQATSPTGAMAMAGASAAHPPQTAGTNQNPSKGHPQLNDALAYLDRVKAEFHDQPEVYNKFLQIMRDFKVNAYEFFALPLFISF